MKPALGAFSFFASGMTFSGWLYSGEWSLLAISITLLVFGALNLLQDMGEWKRKVKLTELRGDINCLMQQSEDLDEFIKLCDVLKDQEKES